MSGEFWGKGYATEAARASVEFGKKNIGLKEIIGLTDPLNIASQRVLEKCGFKVIGEDKYTNPAGVEVEEFVLKLA